MSRRYQDLDKIKKEFERKEKEDLNKARRIAASVIPSIKEDLKDNSLEISIEESGFCRITGPKSFGLRYTAFLYYDYDFILALSQHEKTHLDYEFPNCLLREVLVDRVAAEEFGPHALFSFHLQNVLEGNVLETAYTYHLASLVNIKPLLFHCQKRYVESVLKSHYLEMLSDLLDVINANTHLDKVYVSRKFGNIDIDSQVQNEAKNLFSEFISGLSLKRKYIELYVTNPFLPRIENPESYISDYPKLEDALVLKSLIYKKK